MGCLANHSDVHTKLERCAFVAFLREGKTTADDPRASHANRSSSEGMRGMDALYVLHNIVGCEQHALGSGTDQECMKGRSREEKADDVDVQVGGLVGQVLASHEHENLFQQKREYSPFHEEFVALDQTWHCRSGWNWSWNLQIDWDH